LWLTLNHRHTPNDWNVFGASTDMLVRRYYESRLKKGILNPPESICFMLTDRDVAGAPEKTNEVALWCCEIGISHITFHVDTENPEGLKPFLKKLKDISKFAQLNVYCAGEEFISGEGPDVHVAVGVSGREEIVRSIRRMAQEKVSPDDVDEKMIESHLSFKYEPDLVIKAGGSHLTDFMIWQSVYSELFFTDVNWAEFRKLDLLRALRDYDTRKRRYGK
jgi:undecaprenyl diphosphate synthase